jgi:hypothetical protein
MVEAGNAYNAQKKLISEKKDEEARLKDEEARLRAEGKTAEADNINSKLMLIAAEIRQAEAAKDEARQTELSARLALEKGITTDLTDEYDSTNVADILQQVREDVGNQDWMHKQADFEKHISETLLSKLNEGVGDNELYDHIAKLSNSQAYAFLTERAKSAGMQDQQMIDEFVKKAIEASANDVGDKEKYAKFVQWLDDNKKVSEAQLKEQKKANEIAQQPTDINLAANAAGGIYSSFTPAAVGEAGKEAVIPLERPDDMKRVLNSLSPYEKFKLLKALISKNTKNITWDILADALLYTLGVGKSSGSAPGKVNVTELSNRIIEGAAAQKGHSYTEMVCNQMVEAALKYAGFKPPTTGVVTKHFNHPSMHLVLNDPVNGISPNNSALVPGMIMFSHPFTQAEADQLNKQKGGRRKAGDPGHMGIYAGNGLWWNSTSSKKFKDYSTGKAIDSTASGVALTKPFTTGTYKLYAAGYYDGMFDSTVSLPTAPTPSSSMINALNQTANKNQSDLTTNAKSTIKKAGLLTDEELNNIAKEAGIQNASAMSEFVKQAELILNSNKDKDSIVAILLDIAKYLRGVVTSSKPTVPVARPVAAMYG